MKLFFSMLFVTASYASAELTVKPVNCAPADYAIMHRILTQKTIFSGSEHTRIVLFMLQQGRGPKCEKLVPVKPVYGTPGNKTQVYTLSGGQESYMIFDFTSVEVLGKNGVSIVKQR
ncbi:MAG: hypothetical protein J0M15_06380 [Deltaproteobacteria bacterium]|jgi:hypothetical protein|nr:hypothetical protein [Deltaproteobacteria bacterium]